MLINQAKKPGTQHQNVNILQFPSSNEINVNSATNKPNNYPIANVRVIKPIYLPLRCPGVISDIIVTPQGANKPTLQDFCKLYLIFLITL